jgi:NAD-dependent deacetylase
MTSPDDKILDAAALIATHRPVTVLTGAGVSVESGIPDFRSAGGLWEKFDPMEYASIDAFMASPEKVWKMLFELGETVHGAEPNAGHTALARLEEMGVVSGIITQNIDNLHQRAGSKNVVEFHGNATRLICLHCRRRLRNVTGDVPGDVPRCPDCDEVLKPDVVFFGEAIPTHALREASDLCTSCGVMLVVGTSATVAPASQLPLLARSSGATVIEVNPERTPLTSLSEMSLNGPAGTVLPALVDAVAAKVGS